MQRTVFALEPARLPPPAGWRRLAVRGDAALDVRDDTVMATQLTQRPLTERGAWIYAVPREMLFGHGGRRTPLARIVP